MSEFLIKLEEDLNKWLDRTQNAPDGRIYIIKILIEQINDLKITLYPKDHRPRHFHVKSTQRRIDARFTIDSIELIDDEGGELSRKDIKKIQAYFKYNSSQHQALKKEATRLGIL